jgi:hypothetical protein
LWSRPMEEYAEGKAPEIVVDVPGVLDDRTNC